MSDSQDEQQATPSPDGRDCAGESSVQPAALPYPRGDGYCCDCLAKLAVTKDRRFCLKCLRQRIRDETPITGMTFNEERGRSGARSSQVLGGTTDMRSTDDMD